jgi:hypothetical protein
MVNTEPIEPNLNGVFANKYRKYNVDQAITITYENF